MFGSWKSLRVVDILFFFVDFILATIQLAILLPQAFGQSMFLFLERGPES